jgi:hypothetical protein
MSRRQPLGHERSPRCAAHADEQSVLAAQRAACEERSGAQDELDRRRSWLPDRRYTLPGQAERKTLKDFDWTHNPTIPKRGVFELATLKESFARKESRHSGTLLIGQAKCSNLSKIVKCLSTFAESSPRIAGEYPSEMTG